MNVLIFVMTMLMMLSFMTYARLESYKNSQVFQLFFNHYMEKDERGYINVAAEQRYLKTVASPQVKKGDKEKSPKKKTPNSSSSRISLYMLFDQKKRESQSKEWQQNKILLKNLITTLYSDQAFYQEIIKKRPQFVDELLAMLTQTIDAMSKEKKPKQMVDLANITLPDEELDKVFYKMLHGAPYKEIIENKNPQIKEENNPTTEIDQDDPIQEEEAEEYKSPRGYFSLLDFLTLSSSKQIRVFLAPKEILKAIFHDPSTVETIMIERKALHKQAIEGADTNVLEQTFRNQYDNRRDSSIESSSLDFSITKTNPKVYES